MSNSKCSIFNEFASMGLQSRDRVFKFLEKYEFFDLLEKAKHINHLWELKEDLYKWAFDITEAPKCTVCGKEVKFNFRSLKYPRVCSQSCLNRDSENKEKVRQTCLKKYGVESSTASKEVLEKRKKTNLERYGTDNPMTLSEIKDRKNKTCLEKYGAEHIFQLEEFQNKIKQTWLEKYGTEVPMRAKEVKEKRIQTCLGKYGVESVFQLDEVKEKIKLTNLEKYGVESAMQSKEIIEKRINTCLEKYGVEWTLQSEEIKEKIKWTCLEKYGVKHIFQSEEVKEIRRNNCLEKYGVDNTSKLEHVKEKMKQTCLEKYGVEWVYQSAEIREKIKQTCLEKYGDECPARTASVQEKIYNSKKKNRTFNSSRPENMIYERLLENFPNVKRQYKTADYPFMSDFYIPEKDMYIEYQGSWFHGSEPFDNNNEKHQEIITNWEKKSKELNFKGKPKLQYTNAIKVWTVGDVKKRQWAKEHNLNWIEFFTLDEFNQWYSQISKSDTNVCVTLYN